MAPMMEDFTPYVTGSPGDMPMEAEALMPLESGPPSILPEDEGERRVLAAEMHAKFMDENREEIRRGGDTVVAYLNQLASQADGARASRGFTERMNRNRRRVENRPAIRTDSVTGQVIRDYGDGWLEIGLTQGWTSSAASTAGAYIYRTLFKSNSGLAEWSGIGNRPENRAVESVLDDLTEYYFMVGGLDDVSRPMSFNNVRDGSFGFRVEIVSNPKTSEAEPRLSWLPLQDILWTNPELPTIREQEAIFYIYRGVPYWQARKDAAVWDLTQSPDGAIQFVQVGGKYIGVDKADFTSWINWPGSANVSQSLYAGFSPREGRLSGFPAMDLVDVEARIPFQTWALNGSWTWKCCVAYGIDVGPETDDSPEGRQELADRLGAYENWILGFGIPTNTWGGGTALAGISLLACRPDLYSNAGPSLQWCKLFECGSELQGDSIVDRAGTLEDMADKLCNAMIRITDYNANPAFGVDKRAVADKTMKQINRLLNSNQLVEVPPGGDVAKGLVPYQLPDNQLIDARIAGLKASFDEVVGVNSLQKNGVEGGGADQTATELTLKDNRSRSRLDDTVLGMAETLQNAARFIITRMKDHLGLDGLAKVARRVSGLNALHFERLALTAGDDFLDEYVCRHPMILGEKAQKTAEALMAAYNTWGVPAGGNMDPDKTYEAFMQAQGYPNPQGLLISGGEPIEDPEEEHALMAQGTYVEPSPRENFDRHLSSHLPMLQALRSGQVPIPPDVAEMIATQLEDHIEKTMGLQAVAMEQAMMAAGGPPGGETGASGEPGPPDEIPPPSNPASGGPVS